MLFSAVVAAGVAPSCTEMTGIHLVVDWNNNLRLCFVLPTVLMITDCVDDILRNFGWCSTALFARCVSLSFAVSHGTIMPKVLRRICYLLKNKKTNLMHFNDPFDVPFSFLSSPSFSFFL